MQSIVKTCRESAENLQTIFEKATSADDSSWLKRYKAAIRTLKYGRQEKMENLMKDILEKLDLLHKEDYFQSAVESVDLKAAIKLLEEVDASLPEERGIRFPNHQLRTEMTAPHVIEAGVHKMVQNSQAATILQRLL